MEDILKDVYVQQQPDLIAGRVLSPKEEILRACLKGTYASDNLFEQSLEDIALLSSGPMDHLDRWRDLLELNIIFLLQKRNKAFSKVLIKRFRRLLSQNYWDEFQPQKALIALNASILGINNYTTVKPIQLSQGSAPIEAGDHWNWANLPYLPLHAELGVLWALIGNFNHDAELLGAAERLAIWQCHTLDADALPHWSLFTQEKECNLCLLLTKQYLLFHTVALFCNNSEMEYLAKKQMQHLLSLSKDRPLTLSSLYVLLSTWVDTLASSESIQSKDCELKEYYCDKENALVGYRSLDINLACTLKGSNTGMGSLKWGQVVIVNYGPQVSLLGDNQRFGINDFSRIKNNVKIVKDINRFSISGINALIDNTSNRSLKGGFRNTFHTQAWLNSSQSFDGKSFLLKASFINPGKLHPIYFVYYIKSKNCITQDKKNIQTNSLNCYEGKAQPLTFESENNKVAISHNQPDIFMRVIPLSQDNSFWDANYLVAYEISFLSVVYEWKIEAVSLH